MSKLKEMQDSCAVFAADLKTGNVVWETVEKIEEQGIWGFQSKVFGLTVTFQMMDVFVLNARPFAYSVVLKSTTAKEASAEALQLVKQEAQKLVDLLNVEVKEETPNNSQIVIQKMKEAKENFPAMGFDDEFVRGFEKAFDMAIFITETMNKSSKEKQ